jgi:RNA polymerase sigma-70 factor (ECF subfamily)
MAKSVDLERQRAVVDAFLAASRAGNFEALLTMLDPEVVFRIDGATSPKGISRVVRGASTVGRQFSGRAQGIETALVDGAVAGLVAPRGHLFLVLTFTVSNDKIVEIEAVADPARLRQLHFAVLD